MLELPNSGMDSNIGLPPALRENYLDPRMVNHVDEIMLDMIDTTSSIIPEYIITSSGGDDGGCTGVCGGGGSGEFPVIEVDEKFDLSTALPNRIYHVICGSVA